VPLLDGDIVGLGSVRLAVCLTALDGVETVGA
jgi:hypothetical protein